MYYIQRINLPKNCKVGITNNPDNMTSGVSGKSKDQNIVYTMLSFFYENR